MNREMMGPWARAPTSLGVASASQVGLHHASAAEPEVNMRPGPGLVVMALAFISGARRGTTQIISSSQGSRLGHSSGDDDSGALVRINPWLSACDLAQPKTAPDLQVLDIHNFSFSTKSKKKNFIPFFFSKIKFVVNFKKKKRKFFFENFQFKWKIILYNFPSLFLIFFFLFLCVK